MTRLLLDLLLPLTMVLCTNGKECWLPPLSFSELTDMEELGTTGGQHCYGGAGNIAVMMEWICVVELGFQEEC